MFEKHLEYIFNSIFRDKKKSEQQLIDEELDELGQKNAELKNKVSEKESELRTLKKLMVELGLIKISSKNNDSIHKLS